MTRRLPIAALILLAAGLFTPQYSPAAQVTGVREADAACAQCHAKISESYLRTRMANASGAAQEGLMTGGLKHQPSGIDYRIGEENGAAWLWYARPGDNQIDGKRKLEYFLGSGNHGRTYLYQLNGHWFETPLAYYAEKKGYDLRPAYTNDKQMPLDLPVNSSCLRCHMSATQKEDPGTRSHYSGQPFLHSGITCESCHGDSAAHVASSGKTAVVNPDKLSAAARDSVCINCHLEGDVTVEKPGKSLVDYRPGQSIFEYASYFVAAQNGKIGRAVSQVEALSASQCKRASGDRMSCSSCHDAHSSPAPAEKVSYYRAKCLACHSDGKFAATHFPAQPDCAGCHMPKGAAPDIPHEQWTDHRILRQPNSVELEAANPAPQVLVPTAGTPAEKDDRALGLAYYNLASASGDPKQRAQARALLEGSLQPASTDSVALVALGVLAEWAGDSDSAYRYYHSALLDDRGAYTAGVNVGVLLARAGEMKTALDLWQSIFRVNEDLSDLGLDLASAECLQGRMTDAQNVLRRVLLYNPDYGKARAQLTRLEADSAACPAH